MSILFEPLKVGDLKLSNRILMSPLTRCRTYDDKRIPNELMLEYYVQRASAGLIFSEATSITPMGVGYPNTPGIWSNEQIEGWKKITTAVHNAGGQMLLQLWHVGRVSDPIYLNGELPVAPSAIAPDGHVSLVRPKKSYVTPRALALEEIPGIIEVYRKGAENAKAAGFDAVEIHGANGYLLDQFIHDGSNKRTDRYGGSIENRVRLMLEVTDAVVSVWGKGRVGMHLAPRGDSHSMADSNPLALYRYIAQELGKREIAFICTREALGKDRISGQLKKDFGGVFIVNEQFTKQTAEEIINNGEADAVCFGQLFIANPDLPKRFNLNAELNTLDPQTFYTAGLKGYIDYPILK